MTRSHSSSSTLVALLPLLALSACATEPDKSKATWDPQLEKAALEQRLENENTLVKQQGYQKVLLDLDHLMEKYIQAVWGIGNDRAERQATTIEAAARTLVLDHFAQLVRSAIEVDQGQNRAIALAALGFSQRPEALDPLLNALRDKDPRVAGNAALGLGVLRDGRTPIASLGALVTTEGVSDEVRRTASWSLVRIQPALLDKSGLMSEWQRILATPVEKLDSGVAVHALRGLGLLRDKKLIGNAIPFASHPVPKVREAAAIALGMLGNVDASEALLVLLGPAEANQNVRLAARKALMALAGNVDLGFDVNEWRKVLQRGN